MKKRNKLLLFGFGLVILVLISVSLLSLPKTTWTSENSFIFLPIVISSSDSPKPSDEYIVIGWSDLGMHYYDGDYAVFSILPPYNNIWAQVIKVGDPPQIITEGIKVGFSFLDLG